MTDATKQELSNARVRLETIIEMFDGRKPSETYLELTYLADELDAVLDGVGGYKPDHCANRRKTLQA